MADRIRFSRVGPFMALGAYPKLKFGTKEQAIGRDGTPQATVVVYDEQTQETWKVTVPQGRVGKAKKGDDVYLVGFLARSYVIENKTTKEHEHGISISADSVDVAAG